MADSVGMGRVEDLAADPGFAVLRHRPGQGVHVEHELGGVGRAFLAGLDVDDEDVAAVDDEEIGPAGQHGGLALQAKGVLGLGEDVVAAGQELVPGPGQQGGVLDLPSDGVEVGRLASPPLVVGLEPGGVFAGTLSGDQLGQGGGPDVGKLALCSRHDVDSWCWSWGIATSLSVTVRRPLWANVMSVVGARAGEVVSQGSGACCGLAR